MRELTCHEMTSTGGGVAPLAAGLAIVVAGATLYGAAKSIYEFGKTLGTIIVPDSPVTDTNN